MNKALLEDVAKIFREVFGDPRVSITEETDSSDIDQWDSISNMQLIVAIEDHYHFRFELKEIQSLRNVGELCSCVEKHLSAKADISCCLIPIYLFLSSYHQFYSVSI